MRLHNKTVLITAAGQGIGRASALACASEGANVIAADINAETLASLAEENPPVYLKGGETMRLGIEKLGVQTQHVKPALKS